MKYIITAILGLSCTFLMSCGENNNTGYQYNDPNYYNRDHFRRYPQQGQCNQYGHQWRNTWNMHHNQAHCFNPGNYNGHIPPYHHRGQNYYGVTCYPHLLTYGPQCPHGQMCQSADPHGNWGFCTDMARISPFNFSIWWRW